ncbi:hypothetical protein VNI00_001747 [Paramarasmius palmivorus]|uniref:Uncharacterized protein n=1 Tax=Paramarasmius palmivorus TaxID=297713 RepID=A0AAW0E4V3_9AGAR
MLRLLVNLFALPISLALDPPDPKFLWAYPGKLNPNDTVNAGLPTLSNVQHILVHDASTTGRTYAHHASVEYFNDTLYLGFSSGKVDEDQNGQQSWVVTGKLSGSSWTFSKPRIVVGSALLPNQTSEQDYTYWCSRNIAQRASQPNGFVQYQGEVYAIVEFADIVCYNGASSKYTTGAGRMAIALSSDNSVGCWLSQTKYYAEHQYSKTKLPKALCAADLRNGLNALLNSPATTPMSNEKLINTFGKFYGSDGKTPVIEVTHAVWFGGSDGYWQRFWRDSSGSSLLNWVEFSKDKDGKDWFPNTVTPQNDNIFASNIPDSNTKSFFGVLPDGRTYLVHNPQYYPSTRWRQPLALSVANDGVHFDWVRVLRTNASQEWVPDTRNVKRPGLSYPAAAVAGDYLMVLYSEDKEDIWLSQIPISALA